MTKEEIIEANPVLVQLIGNHGVGAFQLVSKVMDEYAKQREQYWKDRCLAAEDFISATPCDPDITNEQILAGEKWQSLRDQEDQFIEQQNKDNDHAGKDR